MKKVLTLSALVVASFILARCSSTKTATKVDSSPTAMVAEAKKFTPEQMEQGKTIWQSHCNKCHKLYEPQSHSVSKWNNVLPRMNSRAHLNTDEAAMVRAYLLANATDIS